MNNDELIEIIEWCEMLVDRTFALRNKFLCLPTGMVIPIKDIRVIDGIRHDAGDTKIQFKFLCTDTYKPIVSELYVPKYPTYINWPCFRSPPHTFGMSEEDTAKKMSEYEREVAEEKIIRRREVSDYRDDIRAIDPIIEEACDELRIHITKLWDVMGHLC